MSMNEESELEHQQQHQPLMSIGNMATPPPPVPKAANGIVQQYTPNDYHVIHLHDIMQQQPSPPQDPTQVITNNIHPLVYPSICSKPYTCTIHKLRFRPGMALCLQCNMSSFMFRRRPKTSNRPIIILLEPIQWCFYNGESATLPASDQDQERKLLEEEILLLLVVVLTVLECPYPSLPKSLN
jgi:hypothetical protein